MRQRTHRLAGLSVAKEGRPAREINLRAPKPNDLACSPAGHSYEASSSDSRWPDTSRRRSLNGPAGSTVLIFTKASEALTIGEPFDSSNRVVDSDTPANSVSEDGT